MNDWRSLVCEVPDFPKPGICFYDVTPVLAQPTAFASVVKALGNLYPGEAITHVVGIESRGFIFGAAVAIEHGWGFVPVRKPGKLPRPTYAEAFDLEYGSDTLHIHRDALDAGARVLIVDDLIATGGTLAAAVALVNKTGATVVGAAVCIELPALNGRTHLGKVRLQTLLSYTPQKEEVAS